MRKGGRKFRIGVGGASRRASKFNAPAGRRSRAAEAGFALSPPLRRSLGRPGGLRPCGSQAVQFLTLTDSSSIISACKLLNLRESFNYYVRETEGFLIFLGPDSYIGLCQR